MAQDEDPSNGSIDYSKLKSEIDQLIYAIRTAIASFSDLNPNFSNAYNNAWLSLGESAGFGVYGLVGVIDTLGANAVRNAPGLIGGSGGYVPSVPTGIWMESGRIATIGTAAFTETAQAATNARNIGALVVGAKEAGSAIAHDQASDLSNTVGRVLDPAGNLAKTQIATGDALSQQTASTIKQMQTTLRVLQNAYNQHGP